VSVQTLLEQIRKARELKVTVGAWAFHARRPKDLELAKITRSEANTGDLALRFVEGWQGVRVCDLVGGTDETVVEFDRELWEEFVADRPDVYGPVGRAIMDAYLAHGKVQEDARKNSSAG